jgi:hypothetical protein
MGIVLTRTQFAHMSTKEHSFTMVGNQVNVPSASNIPTCPHDNHDAPLAPKPTTSMANSFSSSHSTPTVHLPQWPLQAHLHCYPPTLSVDIPSRSTASSAIVGNDQRSSLHVVRTLSCPIPLPLCSHSDTAGANSKHCCRCRSVGCHIPRCHWYWRASPNGTSGWCVLPPQYDIAITKASIFSRTENLPLPATATGAKGDVGSAVTYGERIRCQHAFTTTVPSLK